MVSIRGAKLTRDVIPELDYSVALTLAAGGQTTIDSPQIASNKRGRLLGLIVSSSIAFKAEVRKVEASIVSLTLVTWFSLDRGWHWKTEDKELITVNYSGLGLDCFRVIITNLDTSQAADVYATFVWDEA